MTFILVNYKGKKKIIKRTLINICEIGNKTMYVFLVRILTLNCQSNHNL